MSKFEFLNVLSTSNLQSKTILDINNPSKSSFQNRVSIQAQIKKKKSFKTNIAHYF